MCKDGFIEDKVTGDCRQNARSTGDENSSIIGNYYGHQFHVKITCKHCKNVIYISSGVIIACIIGGIILLILITIILIGIIVVAMKKRVNSSLHVKDISLK